MLRFWILPAWQSLRLGKRSSVRLGSLKTSGCCTLVFSWKWEFIPLGRTGSKQEHLGDERLEDPDFVCGLKKF